MCSRNYDIEASVHCTVYYANNPGLLLKALAWWYGSNTGCNNASEQWFYVQSLSRKERLVFTARNQNRSIKYRDFGNIRLKKLPQSLGRSVMKGRWREKCPCAVAHWPPARGENFMCRRLSICKDLYTAASLQIRPPQKVYRLGTQKSLDNGESVFLVVT